ncbi:complex I subunit 5 family protein [Marinisporobacter balticus]|uniref:Multisubunit sodium/proton antiporter MrpD subunit n=1 Tax=Marinisporobacter balticus TaxID=2018667 RepID=A0A4R2KGD4_9FIRM|nr:proton-conducting transporter membrane subunit [Marinisporobacter balticus]TCO72663.1 multisubunit sodium/proton antiporter MrpD subunit [Marinisporobacter balticus]
MTYAKNFPLLMILILFISAFIMPLMKKNIFVKGLSLFTMGISMILSIYTWIFITKNGAYFYRVGHWDAPWGIEFKIGMIEAIMAMLFTMVATLILWYSVYSVEKEVKDNKVSFYYLLVNILLGSLLGMVFSNDLFNCFVFIEVTTLASCGIIVVKDKKENIAATLKYLILSSLGSGLVLMGIAFLYDITGNLNMTYIHKEIMNVHAVYKNTLHIAAGLCTVGIGIKSAMFPLHVWLPDAHSSAPASSSAILSALVLKAPILLLIKILYGVFGFEIIREFAILNLILILGTMGMIMGSVLAIKQKEIKRVIAYSSVAQVGYIFFGIGLGNKLGLTMAIFHIIGHAVTKSALFLAAGAMIEKSGKKKLSELKGIGKEMPYTLGLFTIGALSMVGIPILPGFISKWYLSLASIDAGEFMLIGAILMSSLLNALYYFPIIVNGYFGEENLAGKIYKSNEKSIKELLPLMMLIIGMIAIGAGSNKIMDMIRIGLI